MACRLPVTQAAAVARGETIITRPPGFFPEAGPAYSPWGTLQTSIPITAAKAFSDAPPVWFYVGRLANLFTFALLGLAAIACSPRLRTTTLTLLILPSSLYLAAVYSVDAFMNGLAFLWAAWMLRLAGSQTRSPGPAMIAAVVTGAVAVVLTKLVYAPLVLLLLWIPAGSLRVPRGAWVKLCLLALISAVGVTAGWVYLNYANSLIYDSFGHPAKTSFEPQIWLQDPLRVLASVPRTIAAEWKNWPTAIVWLRPPHCTELHHLAVPLAWASLGLALLADAQTLRPTLGQRLIALLVCVLTVCVVILAAALGWTPAHEGHAIGVSGRYFLPIMPAAAVALLPPWSLTPKRLGQLRVVLLVMIGLVNLLAVWTLAASYTTATGVWG